MNLHIKQQMIIPIIISLYLSIKLLVLSVPIYSILDKNEIINLSLETLFNNSLENRFVISQKKSYPQPIQKYFNFTFQPTFMEVISLNTVSQDGMIQLNDYIIYKKIEIFNQPIKIFLTSQNLIILLIFNQKVNIDIYKQCSIKYLNISKESSQQIRRQINCTDMDVDPDHYFLYIECSTKLQHYTIRILLETNQNSLVNNIRYLDNVDTTPHLPFCKQRKIMYIKSVLIRTLRIFNSILIHCPYSNRIDPLSSIAIFFSAVFTPKPTIQTTNFSKIIEYEICQRFILNRENLLLITKGKIFNDSQGYSNPNLIMEYGDQTIQQIRIGSLLGLDELYVLTKSNLYIKYPNLNNVQILNIYEQMMYAKYIAITSNFIFIQLFSTDLDIIKSIIKIYKSQNSIKTLSYRHQIQNDFLLLDCNNYFGYANYFMLFSTSTNYVYLSYYNGYQLSIQYISDQSISTYFTALICIVNNKEQISLEINVRSFEDKNYYIVPWYKENYYEDNVINIRLKQKVEGPLVEFFLLNNSIEQLEEVLNGLYLIDLSQKFDGSKILQNMLAIKVTSSEDTIIQFYYKYDERIIIYECSIIYYNIQSQFKIDKCNAYLNRYIQIQINTQSLIGFEILSPKSHKNNNQNQIYYFIYNNTHVQICSQENICYIHQLVYNATNILIEKLVIVNQNYPKFYILIQTFNKKILILYEIDMISNLNPRVVIQFGSNQFEELKDPDIYITDYQIDINFKSLLIIQLSNSNIYVINKQNSMSNTQDSYHITYQISNGDYGCKNVLQFFLVKNVQNYKIIILCDSLQSNKSKLIQCIVINPFKILYVRQYPLYDYKVSKIMNHYRDDVFIYIGTVRQKEAYYLIYNHMQNTANVLMYRVKVSIEKKVKFLVGNIQERSIKQGIGLIQNHLYAFGNYTYIAKIIQQFNNTYKRSLQLAVRNDQNQLTFITYNIMIDLKNSKIQYHKPIPTIYFEFNDGPQQNIRFMLETANLSGPIEDINIQANCNMVKINKQDIISPQLCLSYSGKYYGNIKSFISLQFEQEMEILLTSNYILCVKQKKITSVIKGNTFEFLKEFYYNKTSNQTLILVYTENINICNLYLLIVNQDCSMQLKSTVTNINGILVNSFDFKAAYPFILIQIPISNYYNYYVCSFNNPNQNQTYFDNCIMLRHSNQTNFFSIDYDIKSTYAVILQSGIGFYHLKNLNESQYLNQTIWINETSLNKININKPYSYINISNLSNIQQGFMIFEIGTNFESFEIQLLISSFEMQVKHVYHKYINCFYDKNSKPRNFGDYVIKVCQQKPSENNIFANLAPLFQKQNKKYIQIFYKKGNQSWPIRMDIISGTQSFVLSNQYLIVNSITNFLCYYKLRSKIEWNIHYVYQKDVSQCNSTIVIYNQYYRTNFSLLIKTHEVEVDKFKYDWVVHTIFGILVIILLIFIMIQKRIDKKEQQRKKLTYDKNFYSNDFEMNLRKKKQKIEFKQLIEPDQ